MKTWRLLFLTFLLYALFAVFFLYKSYQLQQALLQFKQQRQQAIVKSARHHVAHVDSIKQAEIDLGKTLIIP